MPIFSMKVLTRAQILDYWHYVYSLYTAFIYAFSNCFREITEWAKQSFKRSSKKLGSFTTKKMQDTKFKNLQIRLGYPYYYCHQGNCEHLMIFDDMRLGHTMYNILYRMHSSKICSCFSLCITFSTNLLFKGQSESQFSTFFCSHGSLLGTFCTFSCFSIWLFTILLHHLYICDPARSISLMILLSYFVWIFIFCYLLFPCLSLRRFQVFFLSYWSFAYPYICAVLHVLILHGITLPLYNMVCGPFILTDDGPRLG